MPKTCTFILFALIGLSQIASAQEYPGMDQTYFTERSQGNCQNSDPEFTAWFFHRTQAVPRILQILGPVRDQGSTGQCYALTVADMITASTHVRVSGGQVAYLYYQKSLTGTLQRLFGNNEGGFVASAIKATEGQGLCEERIPVVLAQDPDSNSTNNFCEEKAIQIPRFSIYSQPTSGLEMGRQLFSRMDEALNKKKIVGISYRAQDVFPWVKVPFYNSFANHANTVVARQWNPKTLTCDYVIRNTWGERCRPSEGLCYKGYYSVPEKFIDKALQKIDYIKGH